MTQKDRTVKQGMYQPAMITETTKKQTMNLNKILHTLSVEQIEILNYHCERVQAAYDLHRSMDKVNSTKNYNAYISARIQRTKALRKAGFPPFCAGTCDGIIF